MFDEAMKNPDAVVEACRRNKVALAYAGNFVYAPPVAKLRRLIDASGGMLLDLRAEERHSGSHAAYARRWATAGSGSLLRLGSQPIGAVIHLKHSEGKRKFGRPTRVKSCAEDGEPRAEGDVRDDGLG